MLRFASVSATVATTAAVACGQVVPNPYNFAAVTQLAEQAVLGVGVESPVPGFEIRLYQNGRVVYHRSFGAWSLNRLAACDSATKTLSGAVMMSLVDSSPQPFSLNTRVSDYLPGWTGIKSTITIRQCFGHTAGMDGSLLLMAPNLSLRQCANLISDDPLLASPGTAFAYGGTSMHIAGAVAEVAGGQPFITLFQNRITGPLGLTQTRFYISSNINPRVAGGAESTATEFGTFMEMLRNNGRHNGVQVISMQSVREMFTRQTATGLPVLISPFIAPTPDQQSDYGVGVWLTARTGTGVLERALAAGARGFSSWIDFDDGMTGVLSTDLSAAANVQPLLVQLQNAAQAAVRAARGCPADVAGPNQGPFPDGALTADDIIGFLGWYFNGDLQADLSGPSQNPNRDGELTADDIIVYLSGYFAGC
jgi:CubicO group peptidase (beta-lactamase class C family)